MDTTGISAALDRIRETQLAHGELLRDQVGLLNRVMAEQARAGMAIRGISRDRGSSPPVRSPDSSPTPSRLTAKDAVQWVAAAVIIYGVLKGGGDIGLALKALGG
jgi:hypothetical protein